jgi:hypothetical protein
MKVSQNFIFVIARLLRHSQNNIKQDTWNIDYITDNAA